MSKSNLDRRFPYPHVMRFETRVSTFALAALVVLSTACQPGTAPPDTTPTSTPDSDVTAFVDVTVVPMTGAPGDETTQPGQTVLVAGDRITAVGPAGEVEIPAGARVIDGAGRTLIPGLVDMHAHLPPVPADKGDASWRTLRLLLAHGVTTARSLAGHPSHPEIRDRVAAGEILGPTLYVAAPALHDGNTATPGAAREAVRRAESQGFDLIKSHHLTNPEVWAAVQDEARAQELPVSGHVSHQVGLERALEAGQQIEHLDGYLAALLPPGSDEAATANQWGQVPPAPVLEAVDMDRLPSLARQVAASGAWNGPTLALFEKLADTETSTETLRTAPEMRWVPTAALDQWTGQRGQMAAAFGGLDGFVEMRREIVLALHRAGAPLLAGSDTTQLFHLAGPGLHEEIAAFRAAGLPAAAALRTATAAPADYLDALADHGSATGRAADFGRIAPGLRADLVLLRGNPLEEIAATREIDGVMVRGRWLDRQELDGLLDEVEAAAAAE
jgi:imidazolonepropionase-like amidohydrolase